MRSPLGKLLGREWHRDTVYGVAGRSYVASEMSDDPWISSHLELRGEDGEILSGYGWIFPLGTGEVNLGVGTLATARRPADIAVRPLMSHYAGQRREEFRLSGELRAPTSALLPMGGAVSHVAGDNWALIGDAAGCVNPLNGEGIDYGLETGRFVAEAMAADEHLGTVWPQVLREHYGEAFSIARRLAGVATQPRVVAALGPAGHALGLADDAGAALDGQPGRRRRPRPRRPGVALGRAPLDRARRASAVRLSRTGRHGYAPADRSAAGATTKRVQDAVPAPPTGWAVPRCGREVETHTHGVEHLPADGPVLMAATHVSYPDFLFLQDAALARRRLVRFMCRHDVWRVPGVRTAMDRMRHVPVDREAPAGAYLAARRLLREGEAVCAFPEAGISYSYTVRSLMRGVAGLARETGVPVVPVALWGSQRIWSVGRPDERGREPRPDLTRGRRVDVALGEPVTVAPGDDLTEWTRDLGRRLTTLLEGLQGLPHHQPRPGERAAWHPAHLGGAAPTRLEARGLDSVPRSAVPPTWGPSEPTGAAAFRSRRDSSQPSGLVKGSSTRRTGGEASSRASSRAPIVVRTKPAVVCSAAKSGQPSALTVLMTNPWNR